MTIPAGFAQATVVYRNGNNENPAVITWGMNVDLFEGSPQDLAEQIGTEMTAANVHAHQTTEWTRVEILVKFGPDATGPSGSDLSVIPGSDGRPSVPANTAVIISKVTGLGGRRGRGRFYFPGIPEALVDSGGNIGSEFRGDLEEKWNLIRANLEEENAPMVVLHEPGVSAQPGPTLITSLVARARCGTQRERMR